MKRFIINATGRLGDILHATIITRYLRLKHRDAEIIWRTSSLYGLVLDGNPDITRVEKFDGDYLETWNNLKNLPVEEGYTSLFPQIYPDHHKKGVESDLDILSFILQLALGEQEAKQVKLRRPIVIPIPIAHKIAKGLSSSMPIRQGRDRNRLIAFEMGSTSSIPVAWGIAQYKELTKRLKESYNVDSVCVGNSLKELWEGNYIPYSYHPHVIAAFLMDQCDLFIGSMSGISVLACGVIPEIPKIEITPDMRSPYDVSRLSMNAIKYSSSAPAITVRAPSVDEVYDTIVKLLFEK